MAKLSKVDMKEIAVFLKENRRAIIKWSAVGILIGFGSLWVLTALRWLIRLQFVNVETKVGIIFALTALFYILGSMTGKGRPKKKEAWFEDYDGVSWKTRRHVTSTEEVEVEEVPYCARCKAKYLNEKTGLKGTYLMVCPVCQDKKEDYPLSAAYEEALRRAKERLPNPKIIIYICNPKMRVNAFFS